MAGSTRGIFEDTLLEFMDERSKESEDDIDVVFEALPLDWETTPPAPPPPIHAIAHATR